MPSSIAAYLAVLACRMLGLRCKQCRRPASMPDPACPGCRFYRRFLEQRNLDAAWQMIDTGRCPLCDGVARLDPTSLICRNCGFDADWYERQRRSFKDDGHH